MYPKSYGGSDLRSPRYDWLGRGSKVNIPPESLSQEQHFGTKIIPIGSSTKKLWIFKKGGSGPPIRPYAKCLLKTMVASYHYYHLPNAGVYKMRYS